MGQAESIPQNWADIKKSEFNKEWLNAMRLELDNHIEICTFSADVKARLVARGFGQQLGVDYFNMFAPTPTVSSIKAALAIAVQNDWPLYYFDVNQVSVQANLDTDV